MKARIRPARCADAIRIAEIHVDASRIAFTGLLPQWELDGLRANQMARRWAPLTIAHDGGFFVAEEDRVSGFCLLAPARDDHDHNVAEILAIYVDPERQSNGIGTKLIDAALDHAEIRGFTDVTLWVLAGNQRARRFYESFGFASDEIERADHGLRTTAPHLKYKLELRASPALTPPRALSG